MFLIVLGIFVVFAIICFTVFSYFKDWENYQGFKEEAIKWHEKTVELTFDEVMKYSAIKPDKWCINGSSISYQIDKKILLAKANFMCILVLIRNTVNLFNGGQIKRLKQNRKQNCLRVLNSAIL